MPCAGPAVSLLPLIFMQERLGISAAVACLTAAVGLQGFCYAGFHAYVQVLCTTLWLST